MDSRAWEKACQRLEPGASCALCSVQVVLSSPFFALTLVSTMRHAKSRSRVGRDLRGLELTFVRSTPTGRERGLTIEPGQT